MDPHRDPDPDPAFYSMRIRIRVQGPKPMHTHADLDPCQTLKSQNVKILHEKYTYLLNVVKVIKHTYEGTKAFLKGRKPGLFVNFGQFHAQGPDPGQPNQCGSMGIRIHNTGEEIRHLKIKNRRN